MGENMVKSVEQIVDINPQFVSLITKDIIDQGIENIDTFVPQTASYVSSLKQSVSSKNKEKYYSQAKEWALEHLHPPRY